MFIRYGVFLQINVLSITLLSLQKDYIEESEIFQGLLQVEIVLELFWRI